MTEIKYKDTTIPVEAGQTVTLNTTGKKLTGDIEVTAPKESGGGDARDYRILAGALSLSNAKARTLYYSFKSEGSYEEGYGHHSISDSLMGTYGAPLWFKVPVGDKIRLIVNIDVGGADRVTIKVNNIELPLTYKRISKGTGTFWNWDNYESEYFSVPDDTFNLDIEVYKEYNSGGSNE